MKVPPLNVVKNSLDRLILLGESKRWRGPDPYDALSGPIDFLFRSLPARKWTRLAWTQFWKRFPFDLRRVLGVHSECNPKALGLVVHAYLSLGDLPRARYWAEKLSALSIEPGSFGYPFPWQGRAHFLPSRTPNLVATCFAVAALHDFDLAAGENRFEHHLEGAHHFLHSQLLNSHGDFLSYFKSPRVEVHNANLLGAEILARAGDHHTASILVESSLAEQLQNGSLRYGRATHHQWIDNFHTAFNLASLCRIQNRIGENRWENQIARMATHWRRHFFPPGQFPLENTASSRPCQTHAIGVALAFLPSFSPFLEDGEDLAHSLTALSLQHLRSPRGWFYDAPGFPRSARYMRWTQCWMLLGLSRYVQQQRRKQIATQPKTPALSDSRPPGPHPHVPSSPPRNAIRRKPKVWLDFENSPHVPFLAPFRERFLSQGWDVLCTARDRAQTLPLLQLYGFDHEADPDPIPTTRIGKALAILNRTFSLIFRFRSQRPDLAISHGSRAQCLAARILGIPCITFLDYEFVEQGLFRHCCRQILVPEVIDTEVSNPSPSHSRYQTYPGIKEEIYLGAPAPGSVGADAFDDAQVPHSSIRILARPPATRSHYVADSQEGVGSLFERVLHQLLDHHSAHVLLLSRYGDAQTWRSRLPADKASRIHIPEKVYDCRELLTTADLVVGAGGTMTREAATLGIPAITAFPGTLGAVDKYLVESGRLQVLETIDDLQTLQIGKRSQSLRPAPGPHLFDEIFENITRLYRPRQPNN
jgi:predicted glycosyltransferase